MYSYAHFRSQDGTQYRKEVKGHTFSGAELEAIVYIDPEILDTVVEQLSSADDIEVEFVFEIFDSEGRYERTQEIRFPFHDHDWE